MPLNSPRLGLARARSDESGARASGIWKAGGFSRVLHQKGWRNEAGIRRERGWGFPWHHFPYQTELRLIQRVGMLPYPWFVLYARFPSRGSKRIKLVPWRANGEANGAPGLKQWNEQTSIQPSEVPMKIFFSHRGPSLSFF